MEWRRELDAWLVGEGLSPYALAEKIGVTPRTVQRWLTGQIVPDAAARQLLLELGAPVSPERTRPRPAASGRIEARLDKLEQKLDRALELLEELSARGNR